ncbi:Alcohol dehydrogenase GroES-like domain-containing protein [Cladophialophora immunda]|nr:Alcohol dehydrogenase GroES-like domain-containing protein [Cladophialophora immunda]
MPSNRSAYLMSAKARPLEVKSAPYTRPGKSEIVIKNRAVAINPLDHMKQSLGNLLFDWVKYPAILGSDVAGEVVEVGKDVAARFKVGDRVVGHAIGMAKKHNFASHCGFQEYTVLLAHMASHIPDTLSYEDAAVIPLGLSTAACGLFQIDQLAMQLPAVPAAKPTGKTLLVWGGSTSVGFNVIQLAVAAGYEVIATASPRNFDLVKHLGAVDVFDYKSPTVVADIRTAFKGRTTAGALSIGQGAAEKCLDILASCKGNKFLAMASYPVPQTPPERFVVPQIAFHYITSLIYLWIKAKRHGIRSSFIVGDTLVDNEVGPAMYEHFVPQALAEGSFVAAPDSEVVGHGLESIQHAMDLHKKGVSAKKIVVMLEGQ